MTATEVFVLRVFRREMSPTPEIRGVLEIVRSNQERPFNNLTELNWLLQNELSQTESDYPDASHE